jgi:hypothetical protein
MALEATGNVQNTATLLEHDNVTDAKRVVNVIGLFTKHFNELDWSNADANGNYQTITSKLAGATQEVLTLTFDASNNVTSIIRN